MIMTVLVVPAVIAPAREPLAPFADAVVDFFAGVRAGVWVVAADCCAIAACAAVVRSAAVSAGPAFPAAASDSTVESNPTTARAPSHILPGAGRPGMLRFLNSELIEPLLL